MSDTLISRSTTVQATPIHGASAGSESPAPTKAVPTPTEAASVRDQTPPATTSPSEPILITSQGTQTTRPAKTTPTPMVGPLAGPQLPAPTMAVPMPKVEASERGQATPRAIEVAAPNRPAPVGSQATRPTNGAATPIGVSSAGSQTTAAATAVPAPILEAPLPSDFPGDQCRTDAHEYGVAGEHDQPAAVLPATPMGHPLSAANPPQAARLLPPPIFEAPPAEQTPPAPAIPEVAPIVLSPEQADSQRGPAKPDSVPMHVAPVLADHVLALAADILNDLEAVWIANTNRLRQLTRTETDKDGEERGFGLDESHPDVARLAALVGMLDEAQQKAAKNLGSLMRRHPLGPWAKNQRGVGDKQFGRLLACIGDPYIRPEMHHKDGTVEPARPRMVSELWAYAGYHVIKTPVSGHTLRESHTDAAADGSDFPADHAQADTQTPFVGGEQTGHPDHGPRDTQTPPVGVAPKRARGQRANWSADAKMRTYLIAAKCVVQIDKATCPVDEETKSATHADGCKCSPFRKEYDAARAKYADAIHKTPCVRCGLAGKPAPVGSPLSDAHKFARGVRAAAKAFLRDLWRESKRLHEDLPGGHSMFDAQAEHAAGDQTEATSDAA